MIIEEDERVAKQRGANRKSHQKNGRRGRVYKSKPRDIKVKARECIRRLISLGYHTRPPCEGCGVTKNVQAHHHDYSKPYDVEWFCSRCHSAEDRGDLIKTGPKAPPVIRPFQTCVRCSLDVLHLGAKRPRVFLCLPCKVDFIGCPRCLEVKPRNRGRNYCSPCHTLNQSEFKLRRLARNQSAGQKNAGI